MAKFTVINTFKKVVFDNKKKPLVICDIDNTFIRPQHDFEYYFNSLKKDHTGFDIRDIEIMANDMVTMAMGAGMVKQTDKEGFDLMLNKVNELGGKLIFLTARSAFFHTKTVNHLKNAGLVDVDSYEIHYTGNEITKGKYIKKYKLLEGYDHHIFIDDYIQYLDSASVIYPNMNLYLFNYK